jgi:CRP-like cAMP-binding protein
MPSARVRLLEADPDLGRFLTNDELAEARQLAVPVIAFDREETITLGQRLEDQAAFAALLLEGMVLEEMQVGDQVGMRLLGPGDIVSVGGTQSMLVGEVATRAVPDTQLALLGRELLIATHRWPALLRGLHLRYAQQADRLATQLVICQLPRVDQRLLSLMWLLAESWGRVTPTGTTLPVKLTHDVLGALIGARRPTVTLALRDLAERGAVVRQDRGWLLLEHPSGTSRPIESFRSPSLIDDGPSGWIDQEATVAASSAARAASFDLLRQRLDQLRERHAVDRVSFDQNMRALAVVRKRCQDSRDRVARDRVKRRRSQPS